MMVRSLCVWAKWPADLQLRNSRKEY
jgi:hypothetical protein